MGKTELAKSLLPPVLKLDIGKLTFFPDRMRSYSRKSHKSVVLDDVRDLEFLSEHQHVLQSSWEDDAITFASTAGGTREYSKYLYRTPFIVTVNPSTKNLDYFQTHSFLSKPENCVVFELTEKAFQESDAGPSGAGSALA